MAPDDQTTPTGMRRVPALPRGLAEPTPVVLAGTALWLAAMVWYAVQGWLTGELDVRFWTAVCGCALGLFGFGLFRWQRRAARRGSRAAWQGFSGLDR